MTSLIQPFINLLLFRAGPQDMPTSQAVFKFAIISCFVTDVLGASKTLGLNLSALLSLGQIGLLGGFIYLILKMNNKEDRWLQTLTAIFGSLAIINLASLPFIQKIKLLEGGQLALTPGIIIVAVLQLWFFILMIRILRDALEISTGRAFLLSFLVINIIPILLSMVVGAVGVETSALHSVDIDTLIKPSE